MKNILLSLLVVVGVCSCTKVEQEKVDFNNRYIENNPCGITVNGKAILQASPKFIRNEDMILFQKTLLQNPKCEVVEIDAGSYSSGNNQFFVIYK